MNIIEFYTNTLVSLGYVVTDDGYIKVNVGESSKLLTHKGKSVVLPTQEHIETLLSTGEDGSIQVNKILYNVLNEDNIKADSPSLVISKNSAEHRIGNNVHAAGLHLLQVGKNIKMQKSTTMDVNKFLIRIKEASTPNIKNVIDETTIKAWNNLYTASFKEHTPMFKIFLKKRGKIDGTIYSRTCSVKSPVHTALGEWDKNNDIVLGVKLRRKDVIIFKILFEHFIPELSTKGVLSYGSDDSLAPGFVALMVVYINIVGKTQKLVKKLVTTDPDIADIAKINLALTVEDLGAISNYKTELLKIPTYSDTNRDKTIAESTIATTPVNTGTTIATLPSTSVTSIATNNAVNTTPQQPANDDASVVDSILFKQGGYYLPPQGMVQQQPVIQQPQQMMQQPVMQQMMPQQMMSQQIQQPVMQQMVPQQMMPQQMPAANINALTSQYNMQPQQHSASMTKIAPSGLAY